MKEQKKSAFFFAPHVGPKKWWKIYFFLRGGVIYILNQNYSQLRIFLPKKFKEINVAIIFEVSKTIQYLKYFFGIRYQKKNIGKVPGFKWF